MTDSVKKPFDKAQGKQSVRVRMAPSPTGPLHLGTARTTLFNWLFAKSHNGKIILRIEDTDLERSKKEYEEDIINGLKWLGFDWDEGPNVGGQYGPYRQNERLDIYEKYLNKFFDEEKIYYCFCSKEQLEEDRQAMLSQGMAPKYGGRCRNLDPKEAKKRVENGERAAIRFKVPPIEVEFTDIIRGKVAVNAELIGDIVIARNLRSPLFMFAGVVDDFEMKISHVIRGEDHITNTPKQILLQRALGFDEVKYAHLPLILAPDRSKLSKRHLETSLNDYRVEGFLPEALVNFLAFLGWHPTEDKEIMSIEELIEEFDLRRVQKGGAAFNVVKLDWFNGQYIQKMDSYELLNRLEDFIPKIWLENQDLLIKIIDVEKSRMNSLAVFKNLAEPFFELPAYDKKLLLWKDVSEKDTRRNLKMLSEEISKIPESDFGKKRLEQVIMPLTEVWGRGELLWPLRAGLSGREASAGPFELMDILGKDESLKRIKSAADKFNA
ncbi:MAG: glutamate--tRNA ligase [Patescibacteria group bacterium]|nr:glutamate--tRNA ligase [Patescibacteria group bacterium]